MGDRPALQQTLHATTVAVDQRGLVILGASGRGKSSLALQLIALGATLVADDRTVLSQVGNGLLAKSPDTIKGRIEARGVGLLTVPFFSDISIYLSVDLDHDEKERLPFAHEVTLFDRVIPCLHRCSGPHFPAALLLYLRTMKPQQDE